MDVLKPKLVWIEGRCYRFFESGAWSAKDLASTPYVEDSDPQEFSDLNEDACPIDIDIVSMKPSGYRHSFYVPAVFFRFIIGSKGDQLRKLQTDTRTAIKIPKLGEEGDIIISGPTKMSIVSARHRIDLLVESSRQKIRPTHFLSIPMIDKTIVSNFEKFKNTVMSEISQDSRGIQEGVFQTPEKLHITLGMITAVYDNEEKMAIEALAECKEKIIKPIIEKAGPIKITAHGLESFDSDPSNVAVVYSKVITKSNVLQDLANEVIAFFIEKGLVRTKDEKVSLHMTLMNASYLLDKESTRFQRAEKFDATTILKDHSDYYFGEIMLDTIHLCQLEHKTEDGYWEIKSSINLSE